VIRLGQSLVQEPLKRIALDGDEIRKLESLFDVGERNAFRTAGP
jgi:hypothetical protein